MEGFARENKKSKNLQPGNRNGETFWGGATWVEYQLLSRSALIGRLSLVRQKTYINVDLIYWYVATLPKQC